MDPQVNASPESQSLPNASAPPARAASPSQACPTCGAASGLRGGSRAPSWIYALGSVSARFPNISVEKEFAQAVGREHTSGLTDREALHAVVSKPENRYLARQICWLLTVEGLETYLLQPRDLVDLSLLTGAVRPSPSPLDVDVVIGEKGPIAAPQLCNGLMLPIVILDQVYSFDREALVKSIPTPEKISANELAPAAEEVFDRIMQMADNAGATDEHRALNYLAVRYAAIYSTAAEAYRRNRSLTAVDVRPSALSGIRSIVEVVFSYTDRATDVVEKYFVRVDVTEEFPFLVNKLGPYYDR